MNRLKIVIISGKENTQKINFLQKLQDEYNVIIPIRLTNDDQLASQSSLYQLTDYEVFQQNLNLIDSCDDGNMIKSVGFTDHGFSGYTSTILATAVADLYNGQAPVIVLSVAFNEIPYYKKHYPNATMIGFHPEKSTGDLRTFFDDTVDLDDEINSDLFKRILKNMIDDDPMILKK